jgi:hypothetical protein
MIWKYISNTHTHQSVWKVFETTALIYKNEMESLISLEEIEALHLEVFKYLK